MTMTNEEIYRSYKQAKHPERQIGILADLNACRKEEIKTIIKLYEGENNMVQKWTTDMDRILVESREKGTPYGEIAETLGVTIRACENRAYRLSQESKEADKLAAIAKEAETVNPYISDTASDALVMIRGAGYVFSGLEMVMEDNEAKLIAHYRKRVMES